MMNADQGGAGGAGGSAGSGGSAGAGGAGGMAGAGGTGGTGGSVTAPAGYGNDCSTTPCPTGTMPALACEQFAMHTKSICTIACTKPGAQDNAECPAPSTGFCTPKSYCQFQ